LKMAGHPGPAREAQSISASFALDTWLPAGEKELKMDFSKLLSYIPGWIGFLALIIIGLLMFLNGVIEPFGPLDHPNKVGFIVFGLAALLIGAASWIIGGTSQIRGRTGTVGVLVRIEDLPWWGYLVDGGILVAAIVLYFALTA